MTESADQRSVIELLKHPTSRQLVQYAAAVGDFNEHHYDLRFVQSLGIPDLLVHGTLQAAWLAELAARWAGPDRWVSDFEAKYVRMAFPGPYRCVGRVIDQREGAVRLELWGEDAAGHHCTVATATIKTATDDGRNSDEH